TQRFIRSRIENPRAAQSAGQCGHYGVVASLIFFQGGQRLISLGEDNHIKIWDTTTGDLVNHMQIGSLSAWADRRSVLALVDAGNRLATASVTGALRLWDLDTGQVLTSGMLPVSGMIPLAEPKYLLVKLAISPDGKTLAGTIFSVSPSLPGTQDRLVLWDIRE